MGEQPLSNADFRKIMMTPRPGGARPRLEQAHDGKADKKKSGKPFRPKPKSTEDKDDAAAYR